MKQILFVNACMGAGAVPHLAAEPGVSGGLPDPMAGGRSQGADLTGCELPVLTGALAQERDRQAQVDVNSSMFELLPGRWLRPIWW